MVAGVRRGINTTPRESVSPGPFFGSRYEKVSSDPCHAAVVFTGLRSDGHMHDCSNMLVQALDRITNMEELSTLMSDYQESITQTAQQIRMVQQNIEQYAEMVQNTMQLPARRSTLPLFPRALCRKPL